MPHRRIRSDLFFIYSYFSTDGRCFGRALSSCPFALAVRLWSAARWLFHTRYRDYLIITKEDEITRHYRTICFHFCCVMCAAPQPRNCRKCDQLNFHPIVSNLKKKWKSFLLFWKANRSPFLSIRLQIFDPLIFCNDCATEQRRARNAIQVPCNGTHEAVSAPCRIRKEINNICSGGGYGMVLYIVAVVRIP